MDTFIEGRRDVHIINRVLSNSYRALTYVPGTVHYIYYLT